MRTYTVPIEHEEIVQRATQLLGDYDYGVTHVVAEHWHRGFPGVITLDVYNDEHPKLVLIELLLSDMVIDVV